MTVETIAGQRLLTAAAADGLLAATAAGGLAPGQTLATARALYPHLIALEADPAGDIAALTAFASWAQRYTPLTAIDTEQDHGLWLDISGCAHLLGGEPALLADLRTRLARRKLPVRMAIAGTTGAAWALARTQDNTIIPNGAEAQALAKLAIAALRLDARSIAGLHQLGVRTVENLARLPRADVTARFGPLPMLRLDQAHGQIAETIAWPQTVAPFRETVPFTEPIGTVADFAQALELLSERLCRHLAAAGQGGLRFTARFFCLDNTAQTITIATARPVRNPAYVAKLLGMQMETIDPGFGVEAMHLVAEDTAPLSAVQAEAFAVADELDRLATVVDRLSNDIGAARIWRPTPYASHVPERAVTRQPPLEKSPTWERDPTQPRPIRLFPRPEPIEVSAPVPDDPPILFRWRRRVHRIRSATGPERIAAEWWREQARPKDRPETDLIRDYYRVEDTDGARFWVFRAGLQGGGRPPCWFLHGLFG
ncbi:MAG: DNA polymerase Y family protein [Acetobacteraceae bacterium]|nr:DNA polymerase Y family protein [Acetobacteraceae bacterium]MSP29597.1 DNA polymerase Y family protein [Acetobacteraceae bacterium]